MSHNSPSKLFPNSFSISPLTVVLIGEIIFLIFAGWSYRNQACLGLTVYWVLYKLFFYPLFFSPIRNVPGPPLGYPLWGQGGKAVPFQLGLQQQEWAKQYGSVVRVVGPIGDEAVLFLRPEALHKIMVKDWLDYPRPNFVRKFLSHITSNGLFAVTGDEHLQMRKAMSPAFSISNLTARRLVDILASQVDEKEGKIIQMNKWMNKVTLDIICETGFGCRIDSLHNPHNELVEAFEHLSSLQSGEQSWLHPQSHLFIGALIIPGMSKFLQTEFAYRHRHIFSHIKLFASLTTMIGSIHTIKRISAQMLQEKIKESIELGMAEGDSERSEKKNIMSILMRARTREVGNRYRMSDEAMMAQVLTFLVAGHGICASQTLWLLSKDIPSQEKLRAEVTPFYTQNPHLDYKSLQALQWLNCVVMESLRLRPPVPVTIREATKSDYVDGTYIQKGTLLWIPIQVINTWKEVWGDDAEVFRPHRWLDLPKNYNSTFSTFSFIAGHHACIGKTMAIIEMKAVLVALIANFTFEPVSEGQEVQPTVTLPMRPAGEMPLRVKRIYNCNPILST
ncbi:hypothetical protein GYMLUDRAFT_177521 [Collybiopsis luxurians FD-317 M1]|uniref:Cytochrome P450 n=1 Tax=Collybiopsis luxurians FD-317 M1 TaxID=944289 RepID=A0A0D0C8Q8_9AGAR|nr:hypothetical protein GYMLUDRAFT_177521 [Collybiopsis luxurians FD-317 M1]